MMKINFAIVVFGSLLLAIVWTLWVINFNARRPIGRAFAGRISTIIVWIVAFSIFFMWLHSVMAADLKLRKRIIVAHSRPVTIDGMPIGAAPLPTKKNQSVAPSCEPLEGETLKCR